MELEKLQNLKDKLLKIEEKNQQNIGAKKTLLKSLKNDFNISSLEEAKKEFKKQKIKIEELKEDIEISIENLEKELKREGII